MKRKIIFGKLMKMKKKTRILKDSHLLFILDFLSRPDDNTVFASA